MIDWQENFEIATASKEQVIDRMSGVEFPLLNERAAYKKAQLRAGFEMALAMMGAVKINPEALHSMETSTDG